MALSLAWEGSSRRGGMGGLRAGAAGLGSWRWKLGVAALLLGFALVLLAWAADVMLRATIRTWAESRAINLASQAIARAVRDRVAASMAAEELARPVVDSRGRIVGFQYNTPQIARLEAEALLAIREALNGLAQEELPLPLGQLTGLSWLAGAGPGVPVRIVPVGSVETSPRSHFLDAGINQVLHRIYIHVRVEMKVVAPFIDQRFPVEQDIVLAERHVIGEVPQVFLQLYGRPLDLTRLPAGQLVP